jgi:hypothetical protein
MEDDQNFVNMDRFTWQERIAAERKEDFEV